MLKLISLVIIVLLLCACSINPVTHDFELDLVSESQEISIGTQQYMGLRQLQQGDYVVDPGLADYVRDIGKKLAAVSDRQLPYEFAIVNSSDLNAWVLPGGKIGVNRGLLARLECESELVAILAHEIVHAAAGHGASRMSKEKFLAAISLASKSFIDDEGKLDLVLRTVKIGGGLVLLKYGRTHELEADHYGMNYMDRAGFDPGGMVKLQETLERLSKDQNSNWLKIMLATHPPSEERVTKSRAYLAELGSQHDSTECERYQKATQHLKQTTAAYENYDESKIAFEKGDLPQATLLIDRAIDIEPRESLFYGLRAQIHKKNDRKEHSLGDLDKAVNLNPDYWQHYLVRGSIKKTLGDADAALEDFKKSVALLHTVEANYSLGELSLTSNQREQAIDYFLEAWISETPLGIEAGKIVARLDLNKNPDRYLNASISLGENKNIMITVQNNAELPVKILEVELLEGGKKNMWQLKPFQKYPVEEMLKSGDSFTLATSVGPVKKRKLFYKYRARVTEANVAE